MGPKCEKLIFGHNQCLNGGTWDPEGERCECNKGNMGRHCETLIIEGISFTGFPIPYLSYM